MKTYLNIISIFLLSTFIYSCSFMLLSADEKYQPLGGAVIQANRLLLVNYSSIQLKNIQGDEYKNLLKEDYKLMYDRLLPYSVQLNFVDNNWTVRVSDGQKIILTDWLCTKGYIDCWSYNGECSPDTLVVKCDKEHY